jgi:hypothetical protein
LVSGYLPDGSCQISTFHATGAGKLRASATFMDLAKPHPTPYQRDLKFMEVSSVEPICRAVSPESFAQYRIDASD